MEKAAILAWLKTFESIKQPQNFSALKNLNAFEAILKDVDPMFFQELKEENSLIKIRAMFKSIQNYYRSIMHQRFVLPKEIDYMALIEGSEDELLKFCRIIVALAATCEDNEKYVPKLTGLSEEHQHALMGSINAIMAYLSPMDGDDFEVSQEGSGAKSNELKAEVEELKRQKKDMEDNAKKIMQQYSTLKKEFEIVYEEKNSLKTLLEELQQKSAAQKEASTAEVVLKSELTMLKDQLSKSENRRLEMEQIAESRSQQISDLSRKVEELQKKADEAKELQDELDELRHINEKLSKSEGNAEKLKKKVEELTQLKTQLKFAQDEKESLAIKYEALESEYKKVVQLTPAVDDYKDHMRSLEQERDSFNTQLAKLNAELSEKNAVIKELENSKHYDEQQISVLEEKIRELELNPSIATGGGTLANTLSAGETSADMKLKLSKVEKENASLKLSLERYENELASLKQLTSLSVEKDSSEDISEIKKELDAIKGEKVRIEEEKSKLSAQVNKLYEEKNGLLSQQLSIKDQLLEQERLNSDLKKTIAVLEVKGSSGGDLAEKNSELMQQVSGLHQALKKAKDHIVSQDQQLKEMKSSKPKETFSEAVSSLQTTLKQKEEELERNMVIFQSCASLISRKMLMKQLRVLRRNSG